MGTHDPADDMAQEVERQLQLAIAAATLAARKAIAHRQTRLAEAQAHSQARAGELRAQLDRQRTLASTRIQPVFDSGWWENATPAQVGEMWQETTQWRQPTPGEPPSLSDPAVFDRAAERIQQETRSRWQLDVYDVAALAHADNVAEQDRLAATSAAPSVIEDASAESLLGPTDRYDTRARRERLQQRMLAVDVPEDAIEARVLADTAQAHPVTEAVQQEHGLRHGPQRSRPRSNVRQPERTR
jgi:hypothetical protein